MAHLAQPVAQRTRRSKKWNERARIQETVVSEEREQLLCLGTEDMAIIIQSQHESSQHQEVENHHHGSGSESIHSKSDHEHNEEDDLSPMNVPEKRGRFSPSEQKTITDAVGQFLTVSEISYDDFLVILNEKNVINKVLKNAKFYKIIARALPQRSVRSCYRFLKRCFNDRNRKGKWTKEEEEKLVKLVEDMGHAWQDIGKAMGRSADNVYDKYKHLGFDGAEQRRNGCWKIREFVKLLLLVNVRVEQKFLDEGIKAQIDREQLHNARQILGSKNHYNSRNNVQPLIDLGMKYSHASIRSINLQGIGWTEITKKIQKRSMIDCKNKFMQLFQYAIKATTYPDLKITSFLQGTNSQPSIDWSKWPHSDISRQQAKNRFTVLKKTIPNKGTLTLPELTTQIKHRLVQKNQTRLI